MRGVCAIQGGENNEPATFQVLLADPAAILLIKAPSWWGISAPLHDGSWGGYPGVSASFGTPLRRNPLANRNHPENQELIETSRMAGMAEVATNVLHNVGNVLNSINVSATLAQEKVRKSGVSRVSRVAKLLEEHAHDRVAFLTSDPKGLMVPDFICHVAQDLSAEQTGLLEELTSLRQNVDHVKQIISMQQSYARVSGVFEDVEVADLLEDTLRLNAGSLARHEVKVVREFNTLPTICIDKHKVLQILLNLVRNAKFACQNQAGSINK